MIKNLILCALMTAPAVAAVIPVEVKAAITKQIVPININDPVIIELVTLCKSPLKLEHAGLKCPPGISLISATDTSGANPGAKGSEVRQRWNYKLRITPAVSRLNGQYQAQFRVTAVKPDAPAKATHTIDFSLQSENFRSHKSVDGGTHP